LWREGGREGRHFFNFKVPKWEKFPVLVENL
jgi:hypothetical protein